ncbi:hypothetical protein BDD43_2697 [Mucilaginibacter gracilis]|uniref:Uncharacterized protein n=1 Tax=Mucilaginibacter gracilis TaxID=423350 RepID=A0A495J178_9SPHI|nr:hypothetical protein BDD43_2697 [Mucilaginibacter gracilis]
MPEGYFMYTRHYYYFFSVIDDKYQKNNAVKLSPKKIIKSPEKT